MDTNIVLEWAYFTQFNPFTLRVVFKSIVCYYHTFENNLEMKHKFSKYLMESCCLTFDQHFSFKCFPENTFASQIFAKIVQTSFGCSERKWVKTCYKGSWQLGIDHLHCYYRNYMMWKEMLHHFWKNQTKFSWHSPSLKQVMITTTITALDYHEKWKICKVKCHQMNITRQAPVVNYIAIHDFCSVEVSYLFPLICTM